MSKLKTLTAKELRGKKPAEVEKYIIELSKSYGELTHALRTGGEKTTHQFSQIKKAIARAKTIQHEQARKDTE